MCGVYDCVVIDAHRDGSGTMQGYKAGPECVEAVVSYIFARDVGLLANIGCSPPKSACFGT